MPKNGFTSSAIGKKLRVILGALFILIPSPLHAQPTPDPSPSLLEALEHFDPSPQVTGEIPKNSMPKSIRVLTTPEEEEKNRVLMKPPKPPHTPQRQSVKAETSPLNPPVPPRRPERQKASQSFVKEAREKALYEIKGKSGPPVTAKPADNVATAVLPENAERILIPDREQMVKSVESIADITEKSSPPQPFAVTARQRKEPETTFTLLLSMTAEERKALFQKDILPALTRHPEKTVMIRSVSKPKEGLNTARKSALSRGLSVRQALVKNGVPSYRISVRALEKATEEERVEIILKDG